jgi:DNA replication and repair protein RecF
LLTLKNISLVQFKNYDLRHFDFNERIVCISGQNGIGKTNLLDAIYYLCFTKSYFSKSDQQNVHHGSQGFRIEGNFVSEPGAQKVVCVLRENGKKEFFVNDSPYERFSHHIGKLPCVIIAPDDVQIIMGGSEERRRFLDELICQLDSKYLQNLIDYLRVLQQRNSFLKSFPDQASYDRHLLQVYDDQLCSSGTYIFEKRQSSSTSLIPLIKKLYFEIAGGLEPIDIMYSSQIQQDSFPELFKQYRDKDIMFQRTNAGVHKDDIDLTLKNQSFKHIASQGQRKSLLFALRLAEFEILNQQKETAPVLLLDDVFEKLDENRMYNLLRWVCMQNQGQVFITDTHNHRIEENLSKLNVAYQLISL